MIDSFNGDKILTQVIEEDGELYFIRGKNRIMIKERFPTDGQNFESVLSNLVCQKLRNKMNNNSEIAS